MITRAGIPAPATGPGTVATGAGDDPPLVEPPPEGPPVGMLPIREKKLGARAVGATDTSLMAKPVPPPAA